MPIDNSGHLPPQVTANATPDRIYTIDKGTKKTKVDTAAGSGVRFTQTVIYPKDSGRKITVSVFVDTDTLQRLKGEGNLKGHLINEINKIVTLFSVAQTQGYQRLTLTNQHLDRPDQDILSLSRAGQTNPAATTTVRDYLQDPNVQRSIEGMSNLAAQVDILKTALGIRGPPVPETPVPIPVASTHHEPPPAPPSLQTDFGTRMRAHSLEAQMHEGTGQPHAAARGLEFSSPTFNAASKSGPINGGAVPLPVSEPPPDDEFEPITARSALHAASPEAKTMSAGAVPLSSIEPPQDDEFEPITAQSALGAPSPESGPLPPEIAPLSTSESTLKDLNPVDSTEKSLTADQIEVEVHNLRDDIQLLTRLAKDPAMDKELEAARSHLEEKIERLEGQINRLPEEQMVQASILKRKLGNAKIMDTLSSPGMKKHLAGQYHDQEVAKALEGNNFALAWTDRFGLSNADFRLYLKTPDGNVANLPVTFEDGVFQVTDPYGGIRFSASTLEELANLAENELNIAATPQSVRNDISATADILNELSSSLKADRINFTRIAQDIKKTKVRFANKEITQEQYQKELAQLKSRWDFALSLAGSDLQRIKQKIAIANANFARLTPEQQAEVKPQIEALNSWVKNTKPSFDSFFNQIASLHNQYALLNQETGSLDAFFGEADKRLVAFQTDPAYSNAFKIIPQAKA